MLGKLVLIEVENTAIFVVLLYKIQHKSSVNIEDNNLIERLCNPICLLH